MSFSGSNTTAGAKVVNFKGIKANLRREGREVVTMALTELMREAKERAPVRDVFTGASHGRSGLMRPPGAGPRSRMGHPGLIAESGRKVFRRSEESRKLFLEMVKQQSLPRRKYQIIDVNAFGVPGTSVSTYISNPRDYNPVLRDPGGEPRKANKRGWRDITGFIPGAGEAGLPNRVARGRPELAAEAFGRSSAELAPTMKVSEFLSSKGRGEVKRFTKLINQGMDPYGKDDKGRPLSALHRLSTGQTMLGGRLRDEIYMTRVTATEKGISGWVVSPTYYAKYQEYGTSRHRPQPYMRPALYVSRNYFLRMVKLHLERAFR